ncbi:CDP-diacylglycerol diphosphatase [Synechococcus sp. EJ6-Ellesmere]|nr:CDP-diacylglycerol diphosphatase [Synechococcus sp. EJ6-Ellesmere]
MVIAAQQGRPSSDALWRIIESCLPPENTGNYCKCPAFILSCCHDRCEPDQAVVWALTPSFVAIRNSYSCGCEPGFVAGLALPRQRLTGLEDPSRPDAIWPFAWTVAKVHLPSEDSIALLINPPSARSQNQLHVHILQLRPAWRTALDTDTPVLPEGVAAIKLSHGTVTTAEHVRIRAGWLVETQNW